MIFNLIGFKFTQCARSLYIRLSRGNILVLLFISGILLTVALGFNKYKTMDFKYVVIYVTCASKTEGEKISRELLNEKLIVS